MKDGVARRIERALRGPARSLYCFALARRPRGRAAVPAGGPAIVFSPHPDDETLGCGATIATKRRAGARVTVVEMTDGAASHPALIEAEALRGLRAREAVAACSVLGVDAADVVFLGYPDGALAAHAAAAAERVAALLEALRPSDVFLPYAGDVHADHVATHAIVRAALARLPPGRPAPVAYEYPVWFLHHWPLVDASGGGRIPVVTTLRWWLGSARRLLLEFGASTDARPVLDVKRAALRQHRTQVGGFSDDPRWETLAEIAGGDFLPLFLGEREIFRRSGRPGRQREPAGSAKA